MHTLARILRKPMLRVPLLPPTRFSRHEGAGRRSLTTWRRPLLLGAAAALLGACQPVAMNGSGPAVSRSEPVRVALLVPRGADAGLAQSLEDAARLAMADIGSVQVDLRVYDTGGRSDRAAGQAVTAVNDGAQIILGPVFADSVRAVRAAIGSSGVTVLAFSNNPSVAGGNVFILGNTFDTAARRLAGHAARQGKRRILVVHERTEAGVLGQRAIERAVAPTQSGIAGSVAFDFSQQGVVGAVPRIAETARASGADSVFFTSNTVGALPMLLELLPQNGAGPDRYQYLGLTRWDVPADALGLPGAQGAWFTMPDPGVSARFDARFRSAYGQAPHAIAGLAYDGIAAIGASVASGRPDALGRGAMTRSQGFPGATGPVRLMPDGTNERGLAVAQIRGGRVVIIDAAPRGFSGPGF
jgi:ABC-type branched-subunit amino acid transport system substrate-binding protein